MKPEGKENPYSIGVKTLTGAEKLAAGGGGNSFAGFQASDLRAAAAAEASASAAQLDTQMAMVGAQILKSGANVHATVDGGIRDALYRPSEDKVEFREVFKIKGAGAVHESITTEAARLAGVYNTIALQDGVRWPDVPSTIPGKIDYLGLLDMKKPGTLPFDSHNGTKQFWHSMKPTGGDYTNGAVLDMIVDQSVTWYNNALREKSLFDIGKMLHTVQDSFSASHVMRNQQGEVVLFQSYDKQGEHEHGTADVIPKGGTWRDTKGATQALAASTAILHFYNTKQPAQVLEQFLREKVYPFSNGAQNEPAGGTAPQFRPPMKNKTI